MNNPYRGFTLLELMIVVAIVAILTAIAYPSYRTYILRSHRAEAKEALLQLQLAEEKYFLQNNGYAATDALMSTAISSGGLGIPGTTTNGYYAITLQSGVGSSATTYTATATPKASQADDTDCPIFSLNQSNQRVPTPDTNHCWTK